MSQLKYPFNRKMVEAESILNVGLNLAIEFGENWLRPIHERLSNIISGVSEEEAVAWNAYCREIMKTANQWVQDEAYKNPNQKNGSFRLLQIPFIKVLRHKQGKYGTSFFPGLLLCMERRISV